MELKISYNNIELSKKDKIKGLKLPKKLTKDLAYFCGILAGDGSLSKREHKHEYCINCGGNPHNEREFYDSIIKPLLKKIFNLNIEMKLLGTTYGFIIYSKAVFAFLTEKIGLPSGRKHPSLRIPSCFKTEKFKIPFLRGVADTDFSLCLKKGEMKYPVISGCSKTKEFILELNEILKEIGFSTYLMLDHAFYDKRFDKYYTKSIIELPGYKKLDLWMRTIGFRNPKYLERYLQCLEARELRNKR